MQHRRTHSSLEYLQVYPNSYYTIRSSTGVDIVPAPDTVPGRKYNIFNEEVNATGWHIEIIIPDDELFRDLNHTGRIVGLLMLLGLAMIILILWYPSNAIDNARIRPSIFRRRSKDLHSPYIQQYNIIREHFSCKFRQEAIHVFIPLDNRTHCM